MAIYYQRKDEYWKDGNNTLKNYWTITRRTNINTHEGTINHSELEEPTYNEINEVIKNLKPNKAAGPDEILPEFINNGGLPLKQNLFQLIVKIWKQEKIPYEWSECILCPIYKKRR